MNLIRFDDLSVGCVKDVAIAIPSDGALVETHYVLSERARLVGEDVLDLAELFVERRGASLGGRLRLFVEHLLVPIDEEGLGKPDDLHAYVERDGHHRVEHDGIGEEDEQGNDSRAGGRLGWNQRIPWEVGGEQLTRDPLPNAASDGAEEAHRQEEKNNLKWKWNRSLRREFVRVQRTRSSYSKDDEIEEAVDGGPLELGFPGVLHELRVPAGKEDDAVAPLRVAEHASAQEDLVVIQRVLLPIPDHPAFESVQVIVGRLTNDLPVEGADPSLILAHCSSLRKALAALQIGLAIQLRCFNVAQPIGLGGCKEEEVRGYELVVFHPDDVADLHFVPPLFHRFPVPEYMRLSVIDMGVTPVPLLQWVKVQMSTWRKSQSI